MKSVKKILALLLAAVMTVSLLAACGGGSATTPAPQESTPAEASRTTIRPTIPQVLHPVFPPVTRRGVPFRKSSM